MDRRKINPAALASEGMAKTLRYTTFSDREEVLQVEYSTGDGDSLYRVAASHQRGASTDAIVETFHEPRPALEYFYVTIGQAVMDGFMPDPIL